MKKLLLQASVFALMMCAAGKAEAQKDQEFRHVVVTMKSGEKVEGYLKREWHADKSLFKKSNFSFKMTPTPEDKDAVKYTAEEVKCIEYTEKTENAPDGICWESRQLATPSFKSRYHTIPRLVCINRVGEHATAYWWKDWVVETNAKGQRRYLQTFYGIRFHEEGEEGEIVYTYQLVNSVLLKDKKPGLKEFCKKWFKGPEGKERKRQAKEDATWILDMYEAYLKTQKQS